MEFSASGEFRAIVYDKKIVALSQYFDMCYFSDIQNLENIVPQKIQEFFETQLRDRVPLSNYIIDFAVSSISGDPENWKIYVIELNPYNANTDPCLFSWSRDKDLLTKGPFEYRFLKAPLPQLSLRVLSVWKEYVTSE